MLLMKKIAKQISSGCSGFSVGLFSPLPIRVAVRLVGIPYKKYNNRGDCYLSGGQPEV